MDTGLFVNQYEQTSVDGIFFSDPLKFAGEKAVKNLDDLSMNQLNKRTEINEVNEDIFEEIKNVGDLTMLPNRPPWSLDSINPADQ